MLFALKLKMIDYYSKFSEKWLIHKNLQKIKTFENSLNNDDKIYPWDIIDRDQEILMDQGLIHIYWFNTLKGMETQFKNNPNEFLRTKPFLNNVSVPDIPLPTREYRLYSRAINQAYDANELKKLLVDDFLGKPYIRSLKYKGTFVRIQHLYQIVLFKGLTNFDCILDDGVTLEFGAGYGDRANLVYGNNIHRSTYIIVDLPVMCKFQYLYLNSIHNGNVFLHTDINSTIKEHMINIVPLHLIDIIDENVDIFWATYSLTESNNEVFDLLKSKNIFRSKKYFIAFEEKSKLFEFSTSIAHKLESEILLKHFSTGLKNGNYLYY